MIRAKPGPGSRSRDNDPTIRKGNLYVASLANTEEINGQADENRAVVHLLRAVGAGIADLGSGSTTFTRSCRVEFIAEISEGRGFLATSEEIHSVVKRGLGNPGRLVEIAYSVEPLRQHEKGNGLPGDANLAGVVVVRGGHGSTSCKRPGLGFVGGAPDMHTFYMNGWRLQALNQESFFSP